MKIHYLLLLLLFHIPIQAIEVSIEVSEPDSKNWIPIAGDWNGNGQTSMGWYDPIRGHWHLQGNAPFRYGPAPSTWIPIAGDWNNNGFDTIGLYSSETGFYLKNTLSGGNADIRIRFDQVQPPISCLPSSTILNPVSSGWSPLPSGIPFIWESTRKLMFALGANQVHSHRFSPNPNEVGQLTFAKTSAPSGMKTVSISRCRGDFTVSNTCQMEFYEAGSINWTTNQSLPWQCQLNPNTQYYINIRNGSVRFPNVGLCEWVTCNYLMQNMR